MDYEMEEFKRKNPDATMGEKISFKLGMRAMADFYKSEIGERK
jgi:hypothetical protein